MTEVVVVVPYLSFGKRLYACGETIAMDAKTAGMLMKKGVVAEGVDEVPEGAVVLEEVKAEDIAEVVEEAAELPAVDAADSVTTDKGKGGKGGKGGKNKK